MDEKQSKHQRVSCPRCGAYFECKPGLIHQCQCFKVVLSEKENEYIRDKHEDCLCAACLLELKQEYKFRKKKKVLEFLKNRYTRFVKNH